MANLAGVLKDEVSRLARKALKTELDALRKSSSAWRREVAALKRRIAVLERSRAAEGGRSRRDAQADDVVLDEAGAKLRFSIKGLKSLRAKLGLSAEQFGKLVGVSGQSVYLWERGKTTPRRTQLKAIAELRGLGKRKVLERLQQAD